MLCYPLELNCKNFSAASNFTLKSVLRVFLKTLVFSLYLGGHFSWFKGLAKVSRKKTRKDYIFSRKMCDSSVTQ